MQTLQPNLNQFDAVHTLIFYSFHVHFNISYQLRLLPMWPLSEQNYRSVSHLCHLYYQIPARVILFWFNCCNRIMLTAELPFMLCTFRLLILKSTTKICCYIPILANLGHFFHDQPRVCVCGVCVWCVGVCGCVLFNDAINCWVYITLVIDERMSLQHRWNKDSGKLS